MHCLHLHGCFGMGTLGSLLSSTTRLTCFSYIRGHTWPEENLHGHVFVGTVPTCPAIGVACASLIT